MRRPVRCHKCNIVRQFQTMKRLAYGLFECAKGCGNRVLHKNEERIEGKVHKIKEVHLNEFV